MGIGSVTTRAIINPRSSVYGYEFYWKTNSNGALYCDLSDADGNPIRFVGEVVQYIFSPDHDYEPNDGYGLVLTGCDGSQDLFYGTADNLSANFAQRAVPNVNGRPLFLNEYMKLGGKAGNTIGPERAAWFWIYMKT